MPHPYRRASHWVALSALLLGACSATPSSDPDARDPATGVVPPDRPAEVVNVPLQGAWQLDSMGQRSAAQLRLQTAGLTLDAAGGVLGHTGCRVLTGRYRSDAEEQLRFDGLRTPASRHCARTDTGLLRVLAQTRGYRINSRTLTLLGEHEMPLANFSRPLPGPPERAVAQ